MRTTVGQAPIGGAVFDSLVADWGIALAEDGRSARTIRDHLSALRDLRTWLIHRQADLTPSHISPAIIEGWLLDPTSRRGGAMRREQWTAARSFWRWACEIGAVTENPMLSVPAPSASRRQLRLGSASTRKLRSPSRSSGESS